MLRLFVLAACVLAIVPSWSPADEKMSLEAKLVVKKDSYAWPYELRPKEFEAKLKELAEKKKEDGWPSPPAIDVVLQITNTGKEKTTIYVEGDANLLTLTLKGPGVTTAMPLLAFTTDFRLPKAIDLEPGKSHEIQLTALKDGFRGGSRYVYPLAPGEYTLSAAYQLSTEGGAKGPVLKSHEVKLKVQEPK